MLLPVVVWRADLCQFFCVPIIVSLAPYQQPPQEREGRGGEEEGPAGQDPGGGDGDQEAEDRPLQIQVHHAQEWDQGSKLHLTLKLTIFLGKSRTSEKSIHLSIIWEKMKIFNNKIIAPFDLHLNSKSIK